ncbi:uncharacterized protein LOC135809762 [Sycon ciliatum]|uniref:uncharacterized protein LOC135809762 n=1 Tax=Sycon ciliatum TaxID=27933 RepID=UPI0020ABEC66|eukprot:scpid75013/ scgid21003/ 
MPGRCLFTSEMEAFLLNLWGNVLTGKDGQPEKSRVRYDKITEKMNTQGELSGWQAVTPRSAENKLDTMRKKGKRYYKTFRRITRSGPLVEEDFDLKGAFFHWPNFQLYHQLFFRHPSLGANANCADDDSEALVTINVEDLADASATSLSQEPAPKRQLCSDGQVTAMVNAIELDTPTSVAAQSPHLVNHLTSGTTPTRPPAAAVSSVTSQSSSHLADRSMTDAIGSVASNGPIRHPVPAPVLSVAAAQAAMTSAAMTSSVTSSVTSSASCQCHEAIAKYLLQFEERMAQMQAKMAQDRQQFEMKLLLMQQQYEDKREADRREEGERREAKRLEYEQKRESEREKAAHELRQLEKEFNAALLARLFAPR